MSAALTVIGVSLVTSPKLTHSDANLDRNTAALLAALILPFLGALATGGGDRGRLQVTFVASQALVLPAALYGFFALQPWYELLHWSYAGIAGFLVLALPLTIYSLVKK